MKKEEEIDTLPFVYVDRRQIDIIEAIELGDLSGVQTLVRDSDFIKNVINEENVYCYLEQSLMFRKTEITEFILSKIAQPRNFFFDEEKRLTLIEFGCGLGSLAVVEKFIKKDDFIVHKDEMFRNFVMALSESGNEEDNAIGMFFLNSNMLDLKYVDENGENAFHHACKNGCAVIANKILNIDSKYFLSSVNNEGETGLHLATIYSHFDLCIMLRILGADDFSENKQGDNPLISTLKAFEYEKQNILDTQDKQSIVRFNRRFKTFMVYGRKVMDHMKQKRKALKRLR